MADQNEQGYWSALDRRMQVLEQQLTDTRVMLARVQALQETSAMQSTAILTQLAAVDAKIAPLQQYTWKQKGAASILGVIGGLLGSFIYVFMRHK